jgi:hypothetical protein
MTSIIVAVVSAFIGYVWGNIKAFDEYMDSEKKAQAFWKEVEQRGLK